MALLALNLRQKGLSNRTKIIITTLGFIGASLFFGDGIITLQCQCYLRLRVCLLLHLHLQNTLSLSVSEF
jgi:hypothetical protein